MDPGTHGPARTTILRLMAQLVGGVVLVFAMLLLGTAAVWAQPAGLL